MVGISRNSSKPGKERDKEEKKIIKAKEDRR